MRGRVTQVSSRQIEAPSLSSRYEHGVDSGRLAAESATIATAHHAPKSNGFIVKGQNAPGALSFDTISESQEAAATQIVARQEFDSLIDLSKRQNTDEGAIGRQLP